MGELARMDKLSKTVITAQMQVVAETVAPWRTQVLFSLFELGLFDLLSEGGQDRESLSEKTGIPPRSLGRLLDCGVSLGFITKTSGGYRNGDIADETMVSGRPGYMGNWMLLARRWYDSFGELTEAVRQGRAVEDINFMDDPEYRDLFVRGMIDYSRYRGRDILNHIDLSRHRRLLDVGCGPAVYMTMFCEAFPNLSCVGMDLPHAVEIAQGYVAESSVSERITLTTADYREAALSEGSCDVIFLSHVLHQEDKTTCLDLLRRCYTALEPDGLLIVQAMFPEIRKKPSSFAALHDLLALLIFPDGANHRHDEVMEWLEIAGYVDVRHQPMSLLNINSLVIGRKPPTPC